ncbi:MAG: antibiotic biosynthesis monooxygenase [Burkholderiales bacterium]|nr:antibiotic biosynthesis monooxygenase [Burkholderiales bacterium]
MFAVIFEVQPKKERKDEYLDLAKHLKPILEAIDGFIDNERFVNQRNERRILSLSTWRDEKAVVRWRTHGEHHTVQEKGRFEVFEDYHLRVGEVTADSHPPAGGSVDEMRFDETSIGAAKVCTITETSLAEKSSSAGQAAALPAQLGLDTGIGGLVDHEVFESIYNPGKLLLLGSWKDARAARAWTPQPFASASSLRHRHIRVIRDYGMYERREATQYYAEVKRDERG